MAYKGERAKRRKRYKHIKKSSIFNKCTKNSRRILVVLLSIIVISISIAPTYAYFIGTTQLASFNSELDDLIITNGKVNFNVEFDQALMKWYSNSGTLLSASKKNPTTGDYIVYGPVWIKPNGNCITSKIDLLTEYKINKDAGLTNEILKAKVIITITRCDTSGNAIVGDESFEQVKKTTDSSGNSIDITKNNAIAYQVFKLDFKENWTYKIQYKVVLQSSTALQDTLNRFNINFTVNSVKIKATQENNPKWGVVGTEDEYCDNVQQY